MPSIAETSAIQPVPPQQPIQPSLEKAQEMAQQIAKKKASEIKLREINENLSRMSADTENARNASESIEPATESSSAALDTTPTPAPRRQSPKHPRGLPIPRAHGEYKYPFEYESPIRQRTIIESWNSISLSHMAYQLGLPPKLDSRTMMIDPKTNDYDLTQMIIYNCRDSDLHALVSRHPRMKIPETICLLAGTSRSTIWDAIANNTGLMDFRLIQSTSMSFGMCLDLSRTFGVDETDFEGDFVLEPEPYCFKGVIQIDGNSLYGSLLAKIGIFIDRCARSTTVEELEEDGPDHAHGHAGDGVRGRGRVLEGDWHEGRVRLIQMRMDAKTDKNSELASCIKALVCSFYGMLGSRHGAMSSKTCAEITTHLARYYLKKIVRVTQSCGYRNENECMNRGLQIKKRIYEEMRGTVFESIGADIKGNYMSILIPSKKKYEAVSWDGEVETKELASVKKDTLPIVKFVVSKVLTVINSPMTKENKTESHEGGRLWPVLRLEFRLRF
ncbi:DNA polymerase family B domain-containing protein [Penicillium canescens]|uniref:DNA-directed DNA polymerase n=1 Tax=Penicillium canescens TaxID=5083 RepID=A0AAD6N7D9_PENCN|nr:DNA polymerase family B domain-containing protein [Penicillium canescens]KAJ6039497.1 DNA polymerase family B domain-containing protein [Penicillium canescens]